MELLVGALLGLITNLGVAWWFYARASSDLRNEIDRLQAAVTDLQQTRVEFELRQRFDALFDERRKFWELAREAFVSWKNSRSDLPNSIEEFVDSAPPASRLPVGINEHLRDWAASTPPTWNGSAKLLWEFASQIYPGQTPDGQLPRTSLLSSEKFEEFHRARGLIAKFFNLLGESALQRNEIQGAILNGYMETHTRMAKLLTYLEGNLILRTKEEGQGKKYLFTLQQWTPETPLIIHRPSHLSLGTTVKP